MNNARLMCFNCFCKGQEGRHFSLNQGHYKRLKQEGEAASLWTRQLRWKSSKKIEVCGD